MDKQLEEYNQLNDKCSTMEARIKEMAHAERRFTGGMVSVFSLYHSFLVINEELAHPSHIPWDFNFRWVRA